MTNKSLVVAAFYFAAVFAAPINQQTLEKPDTLTLVEKVKINHEKRELECLAQNIFYESAQESYEGKLAVATVTMNRVKSGAFPKTVCGVVYQRGKRGCQFSWTCASKRARLNTVLYEQSLTVAKEVLLEGKTLTSIKNALYFHNVFIQPNWTFATPIKKIGNHIFYIPKRHA